MRVKSKVNVRIFEDSQEIDTLFAPDDDKAEVISDNFNQCDSTRFTIAASGTFAVNLETVSPVNGLYIRAVGPCNVVLNGGAPISLAVPNTNAGTPAKFYYDGVVTTLSIINTSSTTALVGYLAWWGASS